MAETDLPVGPQYDPDPAEAQALADVRSTLWALPESQHHAFVLRHWSGLSQDEIADVLGTTPGAVESLLVRARTTLLDDREQGAECSGVRRRLVHALAPTGGQQAHIDACRRCRTAQTRLLRAAEFATAFALVPRPHVAHALASLVPGFSAPAVAATTTATGAAGAGAGGGAGVATASAATKVALAAKIALRDDDRRRRAERRASGPPRRRARRARKSGEEPRHRRAPPPPRRPTAAAAPAVAGPATGSRPGSRRTRRSPAHPAHPAQAAAGRQGAREGQGARAGRRQGPAGRSPAGHGQGQGEGQADDSRVERRHTRQVGHRGSQRQGHGQAATAGSQGKAEGKAKGKAAARPGSAPLQPAAAGRLPPDTGRGSRRPDSRRPLRRRRISRAVVAALSVTGPAA